MKFNFIFILIFLLQAQWCLAENLTSKFKHGERLSYVAKWTGIPAGEIVMSTNFIEKDQKQMMEMKLEAKSSMVISMMYKVHEVIQSRVHTNTFLADSLYKNSLQGRRHYQETISFNFSDNLIQYQKDNLKNKKNLPEKHTFKITKGIQNIFDPLSIFYYLRTLSWKTLGDESPELFVCADRKGIYSLKFKLAKKKFIETAAFGRREVFYLVPSAEFKGAIVKSGKLELWLDTLTGIMLRMKMSIPVGYASFELQSAKNSELTSTSFRSRRRR